MRSQSLKCILASLLLAVASAFATPYPGYFFPSSAQVGTKLRVLVGGMMMNGVQGAYFTGEGVKVSRIVLVPGFPRAPGKTQPQWIMGWLYDILEGKETKHRELPPEAFSTADVPTDWQENLWWPYLDERDDLELQIICRWWYTPERYPQPTPALDQILILDVEVAPDAKPGRRDLILFDKREASAPHSFYITKEPHVQERFFVYPPRQTWRKSGSLPAALHLPTKLPVLTPPVHIDGQAWPGETDSFSLNLKKGQHLVCDVKGRELMPYQGDAVPGFFNPILRLYNENNHEVAFSDDYFYLPDPVLTYTVPEDGVYRLDIHDNLFRGRQDCVYIISCLLRETDQIPFSPQERAFECVPPPASYEVPAATGGTVVKRGTLDCPGRVDRYFFEVTKPETWQFDLFARRQGSPLDGVLKLYGPMGSLPLSAAPKRAEWDDVQSELFVLKNVGDDDKPIIKTNMLYVGNIPQAECDPTGQWKFTEPGKYCITVSDRVGEGNEFYDYALAMGPVKPTFEVYSSTSAFVAHPGGQSGSFKAALLRKNGFTGPVTFDSTEDFRVNGSFDEGQVETDVTVTSLKGTLTGLTCVQFTASGEGPNGETIKVRVTPCDSAEQAFAYTHYLPQKGFYFCVPGESIREPVKHPLPHFVKADGKGAVQQMKTSHSNGQACTKCHQNKKRSHTHGKACNSCHQGKE